MEHVVEPPKQVPVLRVADVVVAGAGVAGVFAAIAAARAGARTLLVERFGGVGGNIGPGMIDNGHMISGRAHQKVGWECTVYPQLYGIGREFVERYAADGGGSMPPYTPGRCDYPGDASIASAVAQRMLEESGVELLLSTFAADPVMEGDTIRGLFVENKSGRRALRASVVIDATGDADVARRSPAPILYPKQAYEQLDGHAPTGMGLTYVVGGVDWGVFDQAAAGPPSPDDVAWAERELGAGSARGLGAVLPYARAAHRAGAYRLRDSVTLAAVSIGIKAGGLSRLRTPGVAQGRVAPDRVEALDTGDGLQIAALEAALRARAYETWRFYRDHVPGFAESCLLAIAPFLGARGGPCIEGEYTLTMDDCRAGRRFDDVLYLYGEFRALRYTSERGQPLWVDMPYRVIIPKRVNGLLAVGRSASGQPDTLLRNRMAAKVMGEACGIAAAMSVAAGVAPRALDVKALQRRLLDAGFYLGDLSRLKELGLT